jgi:hypothetical protein
MIFFGKLYSYEPRHSRRMVMLEASSSQHLSVHSVADYAVNHGWQLVSQPNQRLMVFEKALDDCGNPIRLVLPSHEDFNDTPLRLTEAVQLLAAIEERPVEVVLASIQERAFAE